MARKDANPGARERAAENRVQALEFRKAGFTYQEIGQKLGVSHVMAHRYVQQSLAELAKQEFTNAAGIHHFQRRVFSLARYTAILRFSFRFHGNVGGR